jgi:Kef-type K+ transport system membrane component KefB
MSQQRLFAWSLTILGGLGFVLAALGVYGLVAQASADRTREFGIRVAIGAGRGHIAGLVIRFAATIAAAGTIGGVALAYFGSRALASMLFGITPVREEVEHGFRSLLGIFAPFFFAVTGANIDMSALLDPELLVLVLVLAVMGILTKLVGGIAGSWKLGKWNSIVVGMGMSPRGEVGIVVAALGLSLALIDNELYAVLLAAVILTTLVAPVMLQWAIPRATRDERHHHGTEAGSGAG